MPDTRRAVPRTDDVLAHPDVLAAGGDLARAQLKGAVRRALQEVREGSLAPGAVVARVVAEVSRPVAGSVPVVNATGVLLHTNLGRAALTDGAVRAVVAAAGSTDVEMDLGTGRRARRGRDVLTALRDAVPDAPDVHVVNNGAAALVLAATVLAAGDADGPREVVVSRGEMVEIGDGFRLHDLVASTGARLREVGTTNRTVLDDYRAALGPRTGMVLKVHPSNFVVRGFTGSVEVRELAGLGAPVVADIGSGLLAPHPSLPDEPDAASALRAGACLVTCSGDKILGGPQAGLLLGEADLVERLRRHPLARALRVDKLTLAALAATLREPRPPVLVALDRPVQELTARAEALARDLAHAGVDAVATPSRAAVGGGCAPGLVLASAAVSVPGDLARPLRTGDPAVVGHVDGGRLLLDLRTVPASEDGRLLEAVLAAGRARR